MGCFGSKDAMLNALEPPQGSRLRGNSFGLRQWDPTEYRGGRQSFPESLSAGSNERSYPDSGPAHASALASPEKEARSLDGKGIQDKSSGYTHEGLSAIPGSLVNIMVPNPRHKCYLVRTKDVPDADKAKDETLTVPKGGNYVGAKDVPDADKSKDELLIVTKEPPQKAALFQMYTLSTNKNVVAFQVAKPSSEANPTSNPALYPEYLGTSVKASTTPSDSVLWEILPGIVQVATPIAALQEASSHFVQSQSDNKNAIYLRSAITPGLYLQEQQSMSAQGEFPVRFATQDQYSMTTQFHLESAQKDAM